MAVTLEQFIKGSVPYDAVVNQLRSYYNGQTSRARFDNEIYIDPKRTTKTVLSLFVNEEAYKPRVDVMDEILDKVFPGDVSNHRDSGSSIGSAIIGYYNPGRYVRIALRRHGQAAPGLSNEGILVNNINFHTKGTNGKGMTIIFTDGKNEARYDNIVKAIPMGTKTAGRKKSDVDLEDNKGNRIGISIKQADAVFWESIESWGYTDGGVWGSGVKGADWYIEKAAEAGLIDIVERTAKKGYFDLVNKQGKKTSLSWEPENLDNFIKGVVFGEDIKEGGDKPGFICKKTFRAKSFNLLDVQKEGPLKDIDVLQVEVDQLIKPKDYLKIKGDAYVLAYYSTNRGTKSTVAKGTRIQAAVRKRAFSGINVSVKKTNGTVEKHTY